jgi:hypothetical protein
MLKGILSKSVGKTPKVNAPFVGDPETNSPNACHQVVASQTKYDCNPSHRQ